MRFCHFLAVSRRFLFSVKFRNYHWARWLFLTVRAHQNLLWFCLTWEQYKLAQVLNSKSDLWMILLKKIKMQKITNKNMLECFYSKILLAPHKLLICSITLILRSSLYWVHIKHETTSSSCAWFTCNNSVNTANGAVWQPMLPYCLVWDQFCNFWHFSNS